VEDMKQGAREREPVVCVSCAGLTVGPVVFDEFDRAICGACDEELRREEAARALCPDCVLDEAPLCSRCGEEAGALMSEPMPWNG
jgi:predicted RNA-binding Zn-ribbon protein involved in translation (DUF1610 family)